VLSVPAIDKLRFIHDTVDRQRGAAADRWSSARDRGAEPAP
jgi:hypothetical protein